MMRGQVSRRTECLAELAVTKFLKDLLDAPLTSFSQQLPALEGCLEYFEQLAQSSGVRSLRMVVDSNNHVSLLSRCLDQVLRQLSTEHAIQQLTAEQADAVDILAFCLKTVCSSYTEKDETSPSAAKVFSTVEATGMLKSLTVVLELAVTEVQKKLPQLSDSSKAHSISLDEPLILLSSSLLYCWGAALHPCENPTASTACSPTILPAASLTAQLLDICRLRTTAVTSHHLGSTRASAQVAKEAEAKALQYCAVTAQFVTSIVMRSLQAACRGLETTAIAVTSNQHVQQLLLLNLGITVTRLHEQHKGVSPITMKSSGTMRSSKDRRIRLQAHSRGLLVALGVPDSCINELCTQVGRTPPYDAMRVALGSTSSQLKLHLDAFTRQAAAADDVSSFAADHPASLPLVQLFLTLVQLAALEPDVRVLDQILLLLIRIVMALQIYACKPSAVKGASADEQCLSEPVASRLLEAICDVLLPAVMVAVKWSEKDLQQPEVDPIFVAAHAELMGQLGMTLLITCPLVPNEFVAEKIFQHDPTAAAYVLEAGLRYYATAPFMCSKAPALDLLLTHQLCAAVYCAATPGDQPSPAARALAHGHSHGQEQRLSRQLCSLLLTCNKVASLAASAQQPVDKWHTTVVGMLSLECGGILSEMLYSSPSHSSRNVRAVPVEWLVLMARGATLAGLGFCKPSFSGAERVWSVDELDCHLSSIFEHLSYLGKQLKLLQHPSVLKEDALQSLQQQLNNIKQSTEQFQVLISSKTCHITHPSKYDSDSRVLGEKLIRFGNEVCANLPSRRCCNNLHCANLLKWSEWQLVRGTSCSACKLAAYCGADCQKQHWPVHKAVCKRLRAAKTAAGK